MAGCSNMRPSRWSLLMIEVMFLASQCLACPQDCTVSVPRFVPKQMPAQMGVLTDPNVHFFLAANLLRKGEYAAAKLAYEVALEYGYEAPGQCYYRLAYIAMRENRPCEADKLLTRGIELEVFRRGYWCEE